MSIKRFRGVFLLLLLLVSFSGCSTSPPIEYQYTIDVVADGDTTLYLPVALDANTSEDRIDEGGVEGQRKVADLVDDFEIVGKGNGVKFNVSKTEKGRALTIHSDGSFTLKAEADYNYLNTHPVSGSQTLGEPIYFDLTMPKTSNTYWAYLDTEGSGSVKIRYELGVSKANYGETYSTEDIEKSDDGYVELENGWQLIKIHRYTSIA